jgi:hypothetical protein
MFDIHCSACDRHTMLSPARVLGIVNDEAGIHVVYRCWCGEPGVLHTGRAAESRRAQVAA